MPSEPNLASFAAASPTVAVYGYEQLWRTSDAGAHWRRIPGTNGAVWWTYLGFTDAVHGVAVGQFRGGYRLYRTPTAVAATAASGFGADDTGSFQPGAEADRETLHPVAHLQLELAGRRALVSNQLIGAGVIDRQLVAPTRITPTPSSTPHTAPAT